MHVYKILLPLRTNYGQSYALEHDAFIAEAVRLAGGVTVGPLVEGHWHNGIAVVREWLTPYTVAVGDTTDWEALLAFAITAFTDQVCFFVTGPAQGDLIDGRGQ
jgi:hypothetical protein